MHALQFAYVLLLLTRTHVQCPHFSAHMLPHPYQASDARPKGHVRSGSGRPSSSSRRPTSSRFSAKRSTTKQVDGASIGKLAGQAAKLQQTIEEGEKEEKFPMARGLVQDPGKSPYR